MTMNDTLANVLSRILNAEKSGKDSSIINNPSKMIKKVLTILKEQDYIGGFKFVDNSKGGFIKVKLAGNINKCGVVKPRFSVTIEEYEKFEKRYLPSKNFGILIVSTSQGMMINTESKKKGIGGRLIAYCY